MINTVKRNAQKSHRHGGSLIGGEGLDDETRGLYLGNLFDGAKTVSPIRLELYGGGKVFCDMVNNEIIEKSWEEND